MGSRDGMQISILISSVHKIVEYSYLPVIKLFQEYVIRIFRLSNKWKAVLIAPDGECYPHRSINYIDKAMISADIHAWKEGKYNAPVKLFKLQIHCQVSVDLTWNLGYLSDIKNPQVFHVILLFKWNNHHWYKAIEILMDPALIYFKHFRGVKIYLTLISCNIFN